MRSGSIETASWRRVLAATGAMAVAGIALVACGSDAGDALDTLPPIRTTTTIATTTTTPYSGRIFYVVKRGDNLSDIARAYKVTSQSIIDLNSLTSTVLQIGQELEIPNDVRLDDTLPPNESSSTTSEP